MGIQPRLIFSIDSGHHIPYKGGTTQGDTQWVRWSSSTTPAQALRGEDAINVMMPNRISQAERKEMFNRLMLEGLYQPAYVIQSDDLNVAFDCGNGYPPAGIECLALPNTAHTSTSVGDIVVVNGAQKMLVMPLGFEEI